MTQPCLVAALAAPALGWAALQVTWYWPRLPDRMASHFNLRLRPDGWMAKRPFVLIYAVTMAGLAVLMIFTTPIGLPALYFLAALFHLVFKFNANPARERLSNLVWVLIAVLVIAAIGVVFLLPQLASVL